MRADVDRPRDQLLAGAALAGDQHGEVVALQPLNLLDDALHRRAGAQEPRQQRLERAVDGEVRRGDRPIARAAELEPLPRDRRDHAQSAHDRMAERPRRRDQAEARAIGVASERLDDEDAAPVRMAGCRRPRERARCVRVAAGRRHHAHIAPGEHDVDHAAVGRR